MNTANDGSPNRHGGSASGLETAADERARERAEAVEERMREVLAVSAGYCPECDGAVFRFASFTSVPEAIGSHLATCELLRARAEAEVDRG